MTISKLTDDLKISSLKEMISPSNLITELPLSESAIKTVVNCRSEIVKILNGEDKRVMLIVGPCSIHDVDAAIEYAERLLKVKERVKNNIQNQQKFMDSVIQKTSITKSYSKTLNAIEAICSEMKEVVKDVNQGYYGTQSV